MLFKVIACAACHIKKFISMTNVVCNHSMTGKLWGCCVISLTHLAILICLHKVVVLLVMPCLQAVVWQGVGKMILKWFYSFKLRVVISIIFIQIGELDRGSSILLPVIACHYKDLTIQPVNSKISQLPSSQCQLQFIASTSTTAAALLSHGYQKFYGCCGHSQI